MDRFFYDETRQRLYLVTDETLDGLGECVVFVAYFLDNGELRDCAMPKNQLAELIEVIDNRPKPTIWQRLMNMPRHKQ